VTDLAKLGMELEMRKYIRSLISQPQGMLLVAGPPGPVRPRPCMRVSSPSIGLLETS